MKQRARYTADDLIIFGREGMCNYGRAVLGGYSDGRNYEKLIQEVETGLAAGGATKIKRIGIRYQPDDHDLYGFHFRPPYRLLVWVRR